MQLFLILACVAVPCLGYSSFQGRIPNGDSVPHPCVAGTWPGVGHQVSQGGGARNPFGYHFNQNNRKWDKCLCETDSDGDGRTNGEELGDPDCTWTPESGKAPPFAADGHPGVCEPIDAANCTQKNIGITVCPENPEKITEGVVPEYGPLCPGSTTYASSIVSSRESTITSAPKETTTTAEDGDPPMDAKSPPGNFASLSLLALALVNAILIVM